MKNNLFQRIVKLFLAVMMVCSCFGTVYAQGVDSQDEQLETEIRISTVRDRDTAYLNQDAELLAYDGETIYENLPKTTTGIIGCFSAASRFRSIDDVYVLKNSALFTETGVGAHYYAFSGYSNTYSEAFTNVQLPTDFNNNSGTRNGYISLGITGSVHGIDMGLCNTGSGWFPFIYDVGNTFTTFASYVSTSSATNAIITVKPINTTTVNMYIRFVDSSGNTTGLVFDRDITVTSGNLVTSSNKIMCRYYRFASLVPVGTDNQSDGTYMTGGQFKNCQLYNGSTYVSWGIGTARISNAWEVSSSKISVSYTEYNDTFSIQHT